MFTQNVGTYESQQPIQSIKWTNLRLQITTCFENIIYTRFEPTVTILAFKRVKMGNCHLKSVSHL